MLFVQGNRDPEFADLTQLQPVIENLAPQSVRREPALSSPNGPGRRLRRPVSNHPSGTAPTPRATLHVIPGADHAFNPPPQSNQTQHHALTQTATTTATWIRQQLQAPDNPPPSVILASAAATQQPQANSLGRAASPVVRPPQTPACADPPLYVAANTISESHRLNDSLSLNCLNNSV